MASTTSNTASCPFQPTERERALLPSLQRGQTPRYLVHVYTSEALDPTDSRLGRLLPRMDDESHDMFQASYIATAETVNAHLRGSHGPESRGTLRSWTTSLLFAINYALYRHDTDPDRPTMDHLHIVVVDTQQWAAGTFLHARDAMQFFAPGCRALQQLLDTELAPGSDRGHHIGEYLTQGVVYAERGGAHASLQTLIDHGLFELFPALRCHRPWSQLAERTSEIRRLYDHFDGTGVQERHVVGVIALAEAAFGGCYTVPVASMLLAFKGRVGDNPVILAEFRTRFSGQFGQFSVFVIACSLLGQAPVDERVAVGDVMQLSPQDVVVEHGASELRRWRHLIHALHPTPHALCAIPGNSYNLRAITMPGLTLHLLALSTEVAVFLSTLRQSRNVIVASRPRHVVIHPEHLDADVLTQTPWDLLVLLRPTRENEPAIPEALRASIRSEYTITVGIPSKLLHTYDARDQQLKARAATAPLTGALDSARRQSTSQSLEVSPALLDFMDALTAEHDGPVTMLNLLQFHHPDGKKRYFQYGQAFVPVAGKRGGDAKLVGNVVAPSGGAVDSRGRVGRAAEDWWNEISIVHYPSIRHFCDMLAGDDYQGINEKYRLAALRDTFLLCTTEFDVETVAAAKL